MRSGSANENGAGQAGAERLPGGLGGRLDSLAYMLALSVRKNIRGGIV